MATFHPPLHPPFHPPNPPTTKHQQECQTLATAPRPLLDSFNSCVLPRLPILLSLLVLFFFVRCCGRQFNFFPTSISWCGSGRNSGPLSSFRLPFVSFIRLSIHSFARCSVRKFLYVLCLLAHYTTLLTLVGLGRRHSLGRSTWLWPTTNGRWRGLLLLPGGRPTSNSGHFALVYAVVGTAEIVG